MEGSRATAGTGKGREPNWGTGCIPLQGKGLGWVTLGSARAGEAVLALGRQCLLQLWTLDTSSSSDPFK